MKSSLAIAAAAAAAVITATATTGCRPDFDLADRQDIFAVPGDRDVMCAASMEWPHIDRRAVDDALDRAVVDGKIVQLFGHDPGQTVPIDKIEMVVADAEARGLTFVTYRELAAGVPHEAGLAFSFDDYYIEHWHAIRDVFTRHHARVTFFVSDYDAFTPAQRAMVRDLEADGHDIEYHSTRHQNAVTYTRAHGLAAYLADDIDPALAVMRADGWDPIVFAYPLGHRSPELDRALLGKFTLLRSVMRECPQSVHQETADVQDDLGDQLTDTLSE